MYLFSSYLLFNAEIEAIRLHKGLAARKEAYLSGTNPANERRPRGRRRIHSCGSCESAGSAGSCGTAALPEMRFRAINLALPGLRGQKCGLRSVL